MSDPPTSCDSADPFDPPDVHWTPVERQLESVRLLGLAIWAVPLLIACVVTCLVWRPPWWIGTTLVLALILIWSATRIPRRVKALQYAIRDRDFFLRKGIMFRRLTIVPYVRIQVVDIDVGPIQRGFGLCTLTITTAAPSLTTNLPGITRETATKLRDILTNRDNLRGVPDSTQAPDELSDPVTPAYVMPTAGCPLQYDTRQESSTPPSSEAAS